MSKATTLVILAVGTIVVAVFVIAGLHLLMTGTNSVRQASLKINDVMASNDYVNSIDNTEVTGLEAKEFSKKFIKLGYYVVFYTTDGTIYSANDLDRPITEKETSKVYSHAQIANNAKFVCSCIKDKKDAIVAVAFTEDGTSQGEFSIEQAKELEDSVEQDDTAMILQYYCYAKYKQGINSNGSLTSFNNATLKYNELASTYENLVYKQISSIDNNSDASYADKATKYNLLASYYDSKTDFNNTVINLINRMLSDKNYALVVGNPPVTQEPATTDDETTVPLETEAPDVTESPEPTETEESATEIPAEPDETDEPDETGNAE